jgi:signal peptidase II
MSKTQTHRARAWALLAGLTLLFLAVDRVTKAIVVRDLALGQEWAPIPALAKIFSITHIQNTGVSFGQLSGLGWLFMVVNVAVMVAVLVYYPRLPAGQWSLHVACALILAGDLGNVIDRLSTLVHFALAKGSLGAALPMAYVTDFIYFHFWPVFNVADLCVVSGVIIVAWVLWRSQPDKATAGSPLATPDERRPAPDA